MSSTLSIAPDTLLIAPSGQLRDEFDASGSPLTLSLRDAPGEHVARFASGDLLRITAPAFQSPATATVAGQFVYKFWLPGGFPVATQCDVWLKVLSVSDRGTHFEYDVARLHGPACRFPAGTPVARYGQVDDQRLLLTSTLDGAPFVDLFDVGAEPWTGAPPRVRLGRLDGLGVIDGPAYGLAAGSPLEAGVQRYTLVDQTGVHLQGGGDDQEANLTAATGETQTVRLGASGRLQAGSNLAAEATTALDLDPAANQLTLRTVLHLEEELRSQGAIALTRDGKTTLLAAADGSFKLGTDIELPEQTGFSYDVAAGSLTLRGTTSLVGNTDLSGVVTVRNEEVSTARVAGDGSLVLGSDVDQPDGVHFSVGGDGSLTVGAGRSGGAALDYDATADQVTIRSALDAQDVAASGAITVAAARDGGTTDDAAPVGAAIGGGGRVRFGTDIAAEEGTAFDLDAAAGTLAVRAQTHVNGDIHAEGDLRLRQDGVTRVFLGRNGDVRFGTDVDTPAGLGFFYTSSSRKLMLTVPLDAQGVNATTVEADQLTTTSLRAQRAAIEAEAVVAGKLAIGDDGVFVVGANDNVKIDNRGVTMRMLPGEDGSVRVLGIARAALINAYQTSDDVQRFDLLAYYNSGIPRLHGSLNLGVDDVGGQASDLYVRLTRYHTGARTIEINASFVDLMSERIQLRGTTNVRGTFEFSGASGQFFRLRNLPSSSTGLPSGAVWNDGGTLKVVP